MTGVQTCALPICTNVCPVHHQPKEPVMYAFSYTVPTQSKRGTFMLAGGGDARSHGGSYAERIVRYNETSPDAMREKVAFVIAEMERRLKLLGFTWADAVSTQAYTARDIGALVGELLDARGLSAGLRNRPNAARRRFTTSSGAPGWVWPKRRAYSASKSRRTSVQ